MFRRVVKLTISLGVALADGVRPGNRGGGVILYYHAVPRTRRNCFARQMDVLAARVQPWALDQSLPADGRWSGISFDDAYVSVLENAVPELVKRHLPFTVFVPTGSLGAPPSWVRSPRHPFRHERVMTPAELRELLRAPGASVGSHTVTHPRLTRLPVAELRRELRDSKAMLEDLLGRPVELLSFPHGEWNDTVLLAAREAGYTRLFGIQPVCLQGRALPEVVGRVAVEPGDSRPEFALKVRGCYRWAAKSRGMATGL